MREGSGMAGMFQWFLVVVFIGAALAKLGAYDRFVRTLTSLPWLSLRAARVAARAVPLLELSLALLLVLLPFVGALAALTALALFTAVIGHEVAAGRSFDCGCFGGADGRPAGKLTLVRNGFLAAPAIALLLLPHSAPLGAVLVGLGLGLVFLLLEIGYETLSLERASR